MANEAGIGSTTKYSVRNKNGETGKMKKKNYAMMNHYATDTSDGFANTWYAVRFESKKQRCEAIKNGITAARPVRADERKECALAIDYSDITKKIGRA